MKVVKKGLNASPPVLIELLERWNLLANGRTCFQPGFLLAPSEERRGVEMKRWRSCIHPITCTRIFI